MKAGIFAAVLALAVALLQMLLLQNRQEATGSGGVPDNKQAFVPQTMIEGHRHFTGADQYDFSVALYPSERFGSTGRGGSYSIGRGGSYLEHSLHR